MVPVMEGNQLHHWSYRLENAKDVIELSVAAHLRLHCYLAYDQEQMCYRDTNGALLDTKDKHEAWIQTVQAIDARVLLEEPAEYRLAA